MHIINSFERHFNGLQNNAYSKRSKGTCNDLLIFLLEVFAKYQGLQRQCTNASLHYMPGSDALLHSLTAHQSRNINVVTVLQSHLQHFTQWNFISTKSTHKQSLPTDHPKSIQSLVRIAQERRVSATH